MYFLKRLPHIYGDGRGVRVATKYEEKEYQYFFKNHFCSNQWWILVYLNCNSAITHKYIKMFIILYFVVLEFELVITVHIIVQNDIIKL